MGHVQRTCFAAVATAVVLGAMGCSSPVEPTEPVGLVTVAESADASTNDVPAEMTWVIRAPQDFRQVWDRLFARRTDRPMPTIDFTTQMVVVVTMGPKPTSGYAVRITSVTRTDRGLVVHVTASSPGPSCAVEQVRTLPVAVSRLRRTDGAVRFDFTRVTRNCDGR